MIKRVVLKGELAMRLNNMVLFAAAFFLIGSSAVWASPYKFAGENSPIQMCLENEDKNGRNSDYLRTERTNCELGSESRADQIDGCSSYCDDLQHEWHECYLNAVDKCICFLDGSSC